ncbi:MAG: ribbon-helix-helix domain-containing protein [Thermoplasmatales archaeon]|nr:ribbon-helix-helix domain-containing protein [Thermoplasmatales archaeon]
MTKTLKVRLPKRIVASIDEVTKEGYFVSRNELIREAIREQLNSLKKRET